MDNFDTIISRIKKHIGVDKNFQVAEIFNLSRPEFSRRKTRGTILPLVVEWGITNKIDLNWLMTGEAHIDEELLEEAIGWTESQLLKRNKKLTNEKKARIILNYYQKYAETGEIVDDKEMERYLRLVS